MEQLKEKFDQIFENADNNISGFSNTGEFYYCLMQDAYNLAKSEDAEKVEAQKQLLESMGETNKQLAKRLLAIQDALERHASAEAILLILNPTKQ